MPNRIMQRNLCVMDEQNWARGGRIPFENLTKAGRGKRYVADRRRQALRLQWITRKSPR